jgi:50S ribosomal protein L16 3-hydroxylase
MRYFLVLFVSFRIAFTESWILESRNRFLTRIQAESSIAEIEGAWNSTVFASSECWGRRPLILRQCFDTESFPSWEDIYELACSDEEDDAIASRLISHQPGTLDTYKLDFGPFLPEDLQSRMLNNKYQASTLVVNDVDRWIPSLSDWMDEYFDFLPRWRRDDAQVSLAMVGGGIGPHVDNYDVFLVQGAGTRKWEVGLEKLSVEDEFASLVVASEVRVLNVSLSSITVELKPGDCLYLPPRMIHWGTSTSDNCMTLSVGGRAPSAAELLSKMSELISSSSHALAVERYTDFDLLRKPDKGLSTGVKDMMKTLVLNLIEDQMEDDAIWGSLVGRLVTEPNRPTLDYPTRLREMDSDWKAELGIWADAEKALEAVLAGNGVLRRAEGISFAWSVTGEASENYKLYAQGRTFLLDDASPSASSLLDRIANGLPLNQERFLELEIELSQKMHDLLIELLEEGFLYGDDS